MADYILIYGGGGREHALLWLLKKSPHVGKAYFTGVNAGMAEIGEHVPLKSIDDALSFAKDKGIALTVFGPEAPLVDGAVDIFKTAGYKAFGPGKAAARLEGSKAWTKRKLAQWNVPTAAFEIFTDYNEAEDYISQTQEPIVVKASGLAAGKGAIVCYTRKEALEAAHMMMVSKKFGEAGNEVVIEEFMKGDEASILAFVDSNGNIKVLPATQDHKPAYNGDKGDNTGGMGAYGPTPVVTDEIMQTTLDKIIKPTVDGMAEDGNPFVGLLYAGIMIKDGEPRLVEYNIRFGDPEIQPLAMILDCDIYELMHATIDGTLKDQKINVLDYIAFSVVMASPGYPNDYEKGKLISGLDNIDAGGDPDVMVFHAGTTLDGAGNVITNGGRVLDVTARAKNHEDAIVKVYDTVEMIKFAGGAHYRDDIGRELNKRKWRNQEDN